MLQEKLARHTGGQNTVLAETVGSDLKGKVSIALYVAAIGLAFVHQNISHVIYVIVAVMWFIPDRRIENKIAN